MKKGHLVLAAELRGIGETEAGIGKTEFGKGRFGPDNLEILTAYLMGKSFTGMRTRDARAWTLVLRGLAGEGAALHLTATGEAAIRALTPNASAVTSAGFIAPPWSRAR